MIRCMVNWLPYLLGSTASSPVFHNFTHVLLWLVLSLMNPAPTATLPVFFALTPRVTCRAWKTAVLPLPFSPHMKVKFGLQHLGLRNS